VRSGRPRFKSPKGNDIHVTMSFGIAVNRHNAKQNRGAHPEGDKALYRAKENGRNKVEQYG